LPSRTTVTVTFCPGFALVSTNIRSCTLRISIDPILMIRSPPLSPAFFAGPSGITSEINIPGGADGSSVYAGIVPSEAPRRRMSPPGGGDATFL
jgi:hypothetical protein